MGWFSPAKSPHNKIKLVSLYFHTMEHKKSSIHYKDLFCNIQNPHLWIHYSMLQIRTIKYLIFQNKISGSELTASNTTMVDILNP